jgi:cell division protein ZapA (FtsZ GTPase activity inhibitor)
MRTIEVTIRDNTHRISCDEKEEKRLQHLVSKFNEEIETLAKSLPSADDKTLYLIAGLTLIDKLETTESKSTAPVASKKQEHDTAMSEAMDTVTEKIENLITTLEKCNIS